MPTDPRIRSAMHELAATLSSPTETSDALRVLTHGAVDAIPGAGFASISIRHPEGPLETLAATDPVIDALDAEQYRLQEGPCYQTATDESLLVSFDLGNDDRWPRYGPIAVEAGLHAQLAVLLAANGDGQRSALNVYANRPYEFDHNSIEVAELFASHASVALGFVRTVEQLGGAMHSRQVIGQATGIVMERYRLTESRAFSFLVRVSRSSNVRLLDVASQIVNGLSDRNAKAQQGTD